MTRDQELAALRIVRLLSQRVIENWDRCNLGDSHEAAGASDSIEELRLALSLRKSPNENP